MDYLAGEKEYLILIVIFKEYFLMIKGLYPKDPFSGQDNINNY